MLLASFNAGVPVFAVHSDVEHVTPRVPTAFEKMVLRLVEAAQSHSALGAISIRAAFEDVLGMADAPRLLAPCIGELCGLQVLAAPVAEDPIEEPLSTWQLTAQGRDFWRRGLLPRRANHETVMLGYDLVSGELIPWREGQTGEPAPQACLDYSVPNLDFAPLVRAALHAKRPPWFKPNTEIVSVQAGVVDTRWRIVALQLDVAADGTLTLRAVNDDAFNAWLRSAQPEIVWERLVAPALGVARAQPISGSPVLSLIDVVAASPIAPRSNAERNVPARKGWSLVVVSGEEPTEDLPAQAADIVHLRPAPRRFSLWPHKLQAPKVADGSIAVQLDTPAELPAGLRRIELRARDGAPQAWSEGVAMVYWGGQGRPVQVRAELTVERAQAVWDLVCTSLREWLASQPQLAVVPMALWVASPEAAVAQWLRHAGTLGSDAWLGELADFLTRLKHRLDVSSEQLGRAPWATTLREACAGLVDRAGSQFSMPQGIELLEALRKLPLRQPALACVVLERMTSQNHDADLQRLRQALDDEAIVLPASLLGEQVRKTLLRVALGGDKAPTWGPHELQVPLQAFAESYGQARRLIPPVLLDQPAQSSAAWHQAMRVQPARTLSAIDELQRAMTNVLTVLKLPKEALDKPAGRLQELRLAMNARLASPLLPGQRAVVIDTNVLLDMPEFLQRMSAQDVPIVSRAVIQELDGLKHPRPAEDPEKQALAQRARAASRALQDLDRIVFEGSRREQCAADLPATRDNEILAAAAYYALSPVLLLSTDRNLRLTAKGVGVLAQTTQDYLKNLNKPQAPVQPARDRSAVR